MRTRQLIFRLCFGILIVAFSLAGFFYWRGWDVFDVLDVHGSWRAYRMGYRRERIELKKRGDLPCIISVLRHPQHSGESVLFVHGFGDNKYSALSLLRDSKDIVTFDWPLHGESNCDGARTLRQAAEVIDELIAHENWRPKKIVGVSLGVPLSTLLTTASSSIKFLWIAPPFLEASSAEKLIGFLRATRDVAATRVYMNRVLTGQRPLPNWVYAAILKRKVRAEPMLNDLDFRALKQRLLSIPASQTQIFVGAQDLLTPRAEFDQDIAQHFAPTLQLVEDCSHDIIHSCMRRLPKIHYR